jgi:hypothetical protein
MSLCIHVGHCFTDCNCLALLGLSGRNWFHKSQLTFMMGIGLQKCYAKAKVASLVFV